MNTSWIDTPSSASILTFIEAHGDKVYRQLGGQYGKEIASNAVFALWQALEAGEFEFLGDQAAWAWLHHACKLISSNNRKPLKSFDELAETGHQATEDFRSRIRGHEANKEEQYQVLIDVLRMANPKIRAAAALVLQGDTMEEAAQKIGMPLSSLSHAFAHLGQKLTGRKRNTNGNKSNKNNELPLFEVGESQ